MNMKQIWQTRIKPALRQAGLDVPYRWARRRVGALALAGKTPQQIFTAIYQNNQWDCIESVSGPGSTLSETEHLRGLLPPLFHELGVETLIDLPCGDFHWFKEIAYPFRRYTGCDIVAALIARNTALYADDVRNFQVLDGLKDPLPSADMLFCRDLLLHLSYRDIRRFFAAVLAADIEWILVSHAVGYKNEDIHTGQGRLVNLMAAPFHFPAPRRIVMEDSKVFGGKFKDIRAMALWRVDDLRAAPGA